jgi:hypothetical protein
MRVKQHYSFSKKRIFLAGLCWLFVLGLAGCDDELIKINSASPDENTIVDMKPGEERIFKVQTQGPVNTSFTKCIWGVTRFYRSTSNKSLYMGERNTEFTFKLDPKENTNLISIEFQVVTLKYVDGWGFLWTYVYDTSRIWNIRVIQNTSPVWDGDYFIRDNQDAKLLQGYTTITGNLVVDRCDPWFYMKKDYPTSLEDLNTLTSIGSNLLISNNHFLSNLNGLDSLNKIGGKLYIYDNNALENLNGLKSLATVGDDLEIQDNPSLISLDMKNLYRVGGNFLVCGNYGLCDELVKQLYDQVKASGGIGGGICTGNKACM